MLMCFQKILSNNFFFNYDLEVISYTLIVSIKQEWKWLTDTNTLAYYTHNYKKCYCLSKPQMMSSQIALDYIADESAQFDETFICVI
jgi:hypothetical protein